MQKGGIGKSTTIQNLAASLLKEKKSVLVLDLDPQGSTSETYGIKNPMETAFDLLKNKKLKNEILKKPMGDIIAASPMLSSVQDQRGVTLQRILKATKYDFVLIDTSPTISNLMVSSLMASDYVILPANPDKYSLTAIQNTLVTIKEVQKENKALKVAGILLIKPNNRIIVKRNCAEALEVIAAKWGTKVFDSKIRECSAIMEAQADRDLINEGRANVVLYAPKSNGAKDYRQFTKELLNDIDN